MDTFFPNCVQVDFQVFNSFSFRLPVTAFGIASSMMMEVVGEFGLDADAQKKVIANIWARETGGVTSGFMGTVKVPTKENESPDKQAERLFKKLNQDDDLLQNLTRFAELLIKYKQKP